MKFKRRYKQSTINGHLHHQLHHFFLERKGVPANLFLVNNHTRNCRPSFNLAINFHKQKNDSIQNLAKLYSVSNIWKNSNSQKQVKGACDSMYNLHLKCWMWFHTAWMQLCQREVTTCISSGILNMSLWCRNVKSPSQNHCQWMHLIVLF